MRDRDLILVTGVPRSGTSLTAGLAALAGAWTGETIGATQYNPKGFFELRVIRDGMNKPALSAIGADPRGQDPLPDLSLLKPRPDWRERACWALTKAGYTSGPVVLKDAKLALLWPLWTEAFPGARWLVTKRDPHAVADSCMRADFMRAEHTMEGWLIWIQRYMVYVNALKAWAEQDSSRWLREVDVDALMRGSAQSTCATMDELGLSLTDSQAKSFLVPREGRPT